MTKTELQKKTKTELLALAKEKNIKVAASATKDEIIEKLLAGESEGAKGKKPAATPKATKPTKAAGQRSPKATASGTQTPPSASLEEGNLLPLISVIFMRSQRVITKIS